MADNIIDPNYVQAIAEDFDATLFDLTKMEIMRLNELRRNEGRRQEIRQDQYAVYKAFDFGIEKVVPPPPWTEEDDKLSDEEFMKKHNLLTMRDVRAKHYEIFKDKSDAARGRKEASLKYIEQLGVSTRTSISEWKLSQFMKRGEILTNRNEINKRFFELKKKEDKRPLKSKMPTKKELGEFSRRVNVDVSNVLVQLDKNVNEAQSKFDELRRSTVLWERELAKRSEQKQKLELQVAAQKTIDYSDQIKQLLKSGKFVLPKQQPPVGLQLLTAPINKTFFSKEQATSLMVPLGQYLISFRVDEANNWFVSVGPGANNIKVKSYIHPHLNGELCFGSMGAPLSEARKRGNFYEYMMVIYDTLAEFQESDGYIPLYEFENEYKRMIGAVR